VTGGIAAYKSIELVRLLTKAGAEVQVVMTHSATRFVGEATFAAVSHRPVAIDLFADADQVPHVRLARQADAIIVAPATAHTLARMAHGLADDLLSNILLMARCPVICAAAMHTEMYEHPATQANIALLRERGIRVLEPEVGELAGGDTGIGRMLEPIDLRDAVASRLAEGKDLAGYRVLVTAGGTHEPIDPVRFVGNRSSGKMGYAIAANAARRGAAVTLVSAPTHLETPAGVEVVDVTTAQQMADEVLARFGEVDVVIKAAAVADFRPAAPADQKIKKRGAVPIVELERTIDILATLGERKDDQLLVGFAAETNDHLAHARKKLDAKHLDLIIMNDVSRKDIGFGADHNEVWLIDADGGERHLERRTKQELADAICTRVGQMLKGRTASTDEGDEV
jgi:phosphopantothenoylcysteine decarboxylase / phosphopantothenate---cysteine ligase